jgi:PPK2 family polyphosphate:nucleotide phosphotransferase
MKIRVDDFRVTQGKNVHLKKWPTRIAPVYASEVAYKALLEAQVEALSQMQRLLYTCQNHALLIIFQGMDAAGKDGAIQHVMSGVNPQGCMVHSFRQPGGDALHHDFLWRTERYLPARGMIGIFNRSYYEEVLVVKVHPEALAAERLPPEPLETLWKHRYRSINDFETHLTRCGTRIVKFFLHLSKEEQRKRLLARIDEPHKSWKLSMSDIEERSFWKEYRKAHEDCLEATSTEGAPWFVIPADDKENARLIVSQILSEEMKALGLSYPKVGAKRAQELKKIRAMLKAGD